MMKYVLSVVAGFAAVFLIIRPGAVSAAVGAAAADCLETIVPSLFAFTALAIYLQKSGLYRVVLKPLTFPLSKLLRIDEELCGVFILSNVGGYPVGANLLSELVKSGRLSEKDAAKMLCCCFGSGPSFVVGIAGVNVFGSAAAGLVLFAVCFVSSLLMAVVVRSGGELSLRESAVKYDLKADAFISSVTSGARVMFTVCAMITGFSVIAAILREIGVNELFERLFSALGAGANSAAIFPAILEITRIKNVSPTVGAASLCAALLSIGGLCVLMQVGALAKGIPLRLFLLSRIPAAVISALAAVPLSEMIPPADMPTLAHNAAVAPFTKNAALSLCVLIMCGILLLEAKKCRR